MGDVITYGSIMRAVADTLKGVRSSWTSTPVTVQNYDEITEGVNDWPLLRVLWKSAKTDAFATNTERSTFGAKVRVTSMTLEILGYAKPRAELAEDLAAQTALLDGIDAVLSAQANKPQFGLQAVQGFNWESTRETYQIGKDADAIQYAGVTTTLELFIF